MALVVARQLESSSGGLYGPYGARNPLVLIHAPLYYRLATFAAWPLWRAGFDPVSASLTAGRLISAFGFLVTIAAVYGLARLGGLPARAGYWAALLVAATPVHGGLPLEVRPDVLGIGLQTTGILLAVSAIHVSRVSLRSQAAAFACFGVAMCVKQHFVMAPLISFLLLVRAWARGQIAFVSMASCGLIALTIVLFYYGTEEWITEGRMSRSIVFAAGNAESVHPSTWFSALRLLLVLSWKCVGLILLLGAAGLAVVSTRQTIVRRAFVAGATILIGLIVALTVCQLVIVKVSFAALLILGLLAMMAVVMPVCVLFERSQIVGPVDAALWVYLLGEIAITMILWRLNDGGWYNYAIEAVVIACVFTGRMLARAFDGAPSRRSLLPTALAALAVPIFAFTDVRQILEKRGVEHAGLARVSKFARRPSSEIFYVDMPGANRLHGRLDLVYDPWLYPVFESIGLAEPRSIWLARALSTGAVRVVVSTSDRQTIDGVGSTLYELGYEDPIRVGEYFIWKRRVTEQKRASAPVEDSVK